jgi:hypothetical protein
MFRSGQCTERMHFLLLPFHPLYRVLVWAVTRHPLRLTGLQYSPLCWHEPIIIYYPEPSGGQLACSNSTYMCQYSVFHPGIGLWRPALFFLWIIFTMAQAVNLRSFRFKPGPAHVGFVVRKGTPVRIFFFPTTACLSCPYYFRGPGQLCPYSDSLGAGRFGNRVPVWGSRFSVHVQTGAGVHPALCIMDTGCLSRGYSDGAWHWPSIPI